MFQNNNQQPQNSIFGGQGGVMQNNNAFGGNQQGGLFNNNTLGGQTNMGGGIFGNQNQTNGLNGTFGPNQLQQQNQGNPSYFGQMQTINNQQIYGQGMVNQQQKHENDVNQMLIQHQQILKHQTEYSRFIALIQKNCIDANQNLVQETQKLREGKVVVTNKANTSIQGGIGNVNNPNVQQTEKKGINIESIEQTGQNLEKIREKNELIFAKLFEIHCLIERVASNANTIERDSNLEMRLFRQFNDIDANISHSNQKLIDLNQKIIDAKNSQEGGELGVNNAQNSSAREQNGSLVNQNISKRKQVLIDMLAQMKKGIEIVKEQHQEDSKDFEILIKKLNQSRTHPF